MTKYYFMILSFLLGCSTPTELKPKAKELEVFSKKPENCEVTGKVVGIHKAGSMELARNHALNSAIKLNGSGIFIDQEVRNGQEMKVYATVYRCD